MKRWSRLLILTVTALILVSPAFAERGDINLRLGLQLGSPTGELVEDVGEFDAASAAGPVVSFEYMVTNLLGIEPSVGWARHDVEVLGQPHSDFTMLPLMVNANFHFLRKDKLELYVGPQLGYVFYGDLEEAGGPGTVGLKNGLAYGGVVGMDVPIADEKWMFNTSAAWVSTKAEIDRPGAADLDIDPVVLTISVGKRF